MNVTADKSADKLNIENVNYSIKINEAPIFEKPNYTMNLMVDGDTINFNATSLKLIINTLLEKNEYLLETNNLKAANKRITLAFVNHTKDIFESKDIILKHLSELYNFDIEFLTKEQEVWELIIQDTSKLMKYKSKESEDRGWGIATNKLTDDISFNNSDLKTIAYEIIPKFDEYIINTNTLNTRFDLTIDTKDFQTLINSLAQYGLSLEKANRKVKNEYINIIFKEAN
jgi:hypothetical protein